MDYIIFLLVTGQRGKKAERKEEGEKRRHLRERKGQRAYTVI
jgi:hypothetical protein